MAEEAQERGYIASLDQEIIYDNYEQVFKSNYIGDTSAFNTDQKFLFQELKMKAMTNRISDQDKLFDAIFSKLNLRREDIL